MMANERSIPQDRKRTGLCAIAIAVMALYGVAFAGEYFDKQDEKAIEHFSRALMIWYETNQLGQPKSNADMEHILTLLNRVYTECEKVSDNTLIKIDKELALQYRNNLQEGARQYEKGMRAYWNAIQSGNRPTAAAKSDLNGGQQKMVRFHEFYNANIEHIMKKLKSKGVDISG